MMDSMLMKRGMDLEYTDGQMERNTQVGGSKENNTDMGSTQGAKRSKLATSMAFGSVVRGLSGLMKQRLQLCEEVNSNIRTCSNKKEQIGKKTHLKVMISKHQRAGVKV